MTTELSSITACSPLSVIDIGLVTPLATGWKESCATMQAGYDAFIHPKRSLHPITEVPFDHKVKGFTRLAHLQELAVANLEREYSGLPLLWAMPEAGRLGLSDFDYTQQKLLNALARRPVFHGKFLREWTKYFDQGRTSLAHQLQHAHHILTTTHFKQVIIMAVDSWLFPPMLNALLAYWGGNKQRVLTDTNTDGFIPAEAAGVMVVSLPKYHSSPYIIDGVANAHEPVSLFSTDISKAEGMSAAIKQACQRANHSLKDYPLCISSASGEQYFFREFNLAQTRNLTSKVSEQSVWHPASHIGDSGCVVGIAMIAMALYGFQSGRIKGERVLCHMSGDTHDRAAVSVAYQQ